MGQLDTAVGQGPSVTGYGFSLGKMDSSIVLSYLAFLTVIIRAQKKVSIVLFGTTSARLSEITVCHVIVLYLIVIEIKIEIAAKH